MEAWKPVVGFEERYEVSSHGRVRRCGHPYRNSPVGFVLRPDTSTKGGYCRVTLFDGSGARTRQVVHRLVMAAFVGPCRDGQQVNHKDGNTSNNQLRNLEYCTVSENGLHMSRVLGRWKGAHGSTHHLAKLTEVDVRRIRDLYASGVRIAELARLYKMTHCPISMIVHRKRWRHVS